MAYFARAVHSHHPFPIDNAFSMGNKTPSRRQAMQPVVNISEEDRATDTGNMHKMVKIARVVPEIYASTVGKKTLAGDTRCGLS